MRIVHICTLFACGFSVTAAFQLTGARPASAHDWLAGKHNAAGELCCFATRANGLPPDCRQTRAEWAPGGWRVLDPSTGRTWRIGEDEVMPAEDGLWWLCRTSWDERPRCVFGPKAGS